MICFSGRTFRDAALRERPFFLPSKPSFFSAARSCAIADCGRSAPPVKGPARGSRRRQSALLTKPQPTARDAMVSAPSPEDARGRRQRATAAPATPSDDGSVEPRDPARVLLAELLLRVDQVRDGGLALTPRREPGRRGNRVAFGLALDREVRAAGEEQ